MTIDPFADRLARVRNRFVSTLASKIDDTYAVLPNLSAIAPAARACVTEVYTRMHGIVGIGPAVGFPATGRAAHDVEDVLRSPYRDGRGLTAEEIAALTDSLHALREIASCELQSFHPVSK
jgi:chemotaxis protein histidine kinase CheA